MSTDRVIRFLKFKPQWVVFLTIFVVAIVKSGVWVMGNLEASRQIALSPFARPFENHDADYLINSWFINFVAHILDFTTPTKYLMLHVVLTVMSVFIGFKIVSRQIPGKLLTYAIVIFALLPVNAGIFYWIGMDGVLVCCFMLTFFLKNPLARISMGIIIGMQHFEIGLVAILSLIAYDVAAQKSRFALKKMENSLTLFAGLLLGKFFLSLIFRSSGLVLQETRFSLGFENFRHNMVVHVRFLPAAIFTMFGVLWLLVLKMDAHNKRAFLLATTIPIAASLFVWDQTRILQVSSTLLAMRALVLNKELLSLISLSELKYLLLAWFVVPWIWIWQAFLGPVTGYDIMYIYSRIFDTGTAPSGPALFWWAFPRTLL
jgi:hypothetical protein